MADYIYLDNQILDGHTYSGRYAGIERRSFGRNYFGLKIHFDQEFPRDNKGVTYVAQNTDSVLGAKYQSLYNRFNSLVINESITIKRVGSSYFFITKGQYLGIISSEIAWSEAEEKALQELYQNGVIISDIEKIYARESLDINFKILSLKSSKIPYKEHIFDYFTEHLDDFRDKKFVISASSRDCPGEVRCDRDFQDQNSTFIEPEQSFFSAFNITFNDYKGLISFSFIHNELSTPKYNNTPVYNVLYKDITTGYLNKIINHLNSQNNQYYGIISLEDFGKDCSYSSYFIAVTDDETLYQKFDKDYVPSFLRYLGLLKTKYVSEVLEKAQESTDKVHKESIRSALTAISARNMSHNLGGHLIYYTKLDIQRIAEDFIRPYEDIKIPSQVKETAPEIRGAAKLFSYLRGRMNHIAAIIKEDKAPYLPVNVATQFYKELVIDEIPLHYCRQEYDPEDDYKKTTNFFLKEIVRSENYTRPSVFPEKEDNNSGMLKLSFDIWDDNDKCFLNIKPNELISNSHISDVDLALPGGILAAHALYNILENFIRNSAKYNFYNPRPDNLEICIKLRVFENYVEFIIHDKKGDANRESNTGNTLFNILSNQLITSTLIDKKDDSAINKNLGLKEMLISALWLNSNEYDESLSELFTKINDKPEERVKILSKFGLTYVMVEGNNIIFPEALSKKQKDSIKVTVGEDTNLGIRFTVPKYYPVYYLPEKIDNLYSIKANVVCDSRQQERPSGFENRFPHFIYKSEIDDNRREIPKDDVEEEPKGKDYDEYVALYSAIIKLFPQINDYCLCVGSAPREPNIKVSIDEEWKYLLYSSHLSETSTIKEYNKYDKYSYVDSISGRNMTKILESIMFQAISRETQQFHTWRDKSLCLQIKESALTRITIIDERFFNGLEWKTKEKDSHDTDKDKAINYSGTQIEQQYRGIRVLNYGNQCPDAKNTYKVEGFDSLYGNRFVDNGPYKGNENRTTFLSIHQGIIEKMLQNTDDPVITSICGDVRDNPFATDRVQKLMKKFEQVFFGDTNQSCPRICIHSGRGKLTKDLNDSLNGYPFINVTTLQGLFEDSKFLLSQLFFNLKY